MMSEMLDPVTPGGSEESICVHDAGRGRMAAGLVELRSPERTDVRSAGSAPVEN
jgi:hypothetical protein